MLTYHLSNLFEYDVDTQRFSAEISMLSAGGKRPAFCQIFNDSADEGLVLVSRHTGTEVHYVANRTNSNNEGEILSWELIPTDASLRKVPSCRGTSIVVYNT